MLSSDKCNIVFPSQTINQWKLAWRKEKKINYILAIFYCSLTQREKCPNTEFFLVRIFLYFDWIRRFTEEIIWIQTKCSKIQSRKNSVFGHFSRSVKDIPSHLINFSNSFLTMQLTCKFSIFCKGLSLGLRSDPNLMNSWRRCEFLSSILLLVTLFLRKKLDTWSQTVKASNLRRVFFFKSKS